MVADASSRQVHFGKTVRVGVAFLTIDTHITFITTVGLHKFDTLDKHASRSAARVVYCAVEWFNKIGYKFDDALRSVKLAVFLSGINGELL